MNNGSIEYNWRLLSLSAPPRFSAIRVQVMQTPLIFEVLLICFSNIHLHKSIYNKINRPSYCGKGVHFSGEETLLLQIGPESASSNASSQPGKTINE